MARQATLNSGPGASVNGMLHGIGDLGSNVVALTTLQARLGAEDFRESARHAQPALIASAILIPLALASATVGLLGVAYWLASAMGMPLGRSLLIVAAGGIALTLALAVFALRRFRASLVSFRRSQEEFERNIAWLRTILMHGSGR